MKFIIFQLLFLAFGLMSLLLVARVLGCLFSSKVVAQVRRHPILHFFWLLFVVAGYYVLLVVLPSWPPVSIERSKQRQIVLERVNSAGGWNELWREGNSLTTNHADGYFYWFPPSTGAMVYPNPQTEPHKFYVTNLDYGPLPPAIAALKPREIRMDSPSVIQIKIFGMHRTGGRAIPYYGIDLVYSNLTNIYTPQIGRGVSGNGHSRFREITNGVFEIY